MVLALTELVTAAMKTYGGDEEAGGRESVEGEACCPSFEDGSLQALNPSLGYLWK